LKLLWTPEAARDRRTIRDYIARENPGAAVRIDRRFSEAARRLADFPMLGRPGRVAGTCEFIPHESDRLVHEIEDETVWVLALVHTARAWPPADG
jgi:plasmid stabilization system protein ParE